MSNQDSQSQRRDRTWVIRLGDRTMIARGLEHSVWSDLSHLSLTASWPAFIASAAGVFLVFNAIFAVLYWLGDHPVANVSSDAFLSYLYFSIETLSTAGYGDMHPQTNYGHVVATVELFTGIFSMSLMTGLIFARFSRPRARMIFARHPLIANHDDKLSLMIRFANARHNAITNATARLWMLNDIMTAEGGGFRRFVELPLKSGESPMFALSWTIFHIIDAASPLAGMGPEDLQRGTVNFALLVTGYDESSGQMLRARKLYDYTDVRFKHRYVDLFVEDDSGLTVMDYGRLHDIASE